MLAPSNKVRFLKLHCISLAPLRNRNRSPLAPAENQDKARETYKFMNRIVRQRFPGRLPCNPLFKGNTGNLRNISQH
uniref:Uncharacterized protein n=1 Tax=Utricularia reniformis TaxID=192314 RepID=A0A1Y0B3N5_9LAMI|nr:hypothetical protein AEK19_MT1765 [Utricularia reniformis]ART31939.1 hypothetical protein AEK19_MT1765 [Utricularia reniformis]